MSGCHTSATSVNLTNGPRQDVYTNCHARMNQKLNGSKVIPRSDLKRALMTAMYNSKAVPKRVFGEDTPELAMFYETSYEMLPGVVLLNQILTALWQPYKDSHDWVMPDGFEVKVKVMVDMEDQIEVLGEKFDIPYKIQAPMEKGISLSANITHSVDGFVVREMGRRCNYNQDQYDSVLHMLLSDAEGNTFGIGSGRGKDRALGRQLWLNQKTGFFSAVILEHLDGENFGMLNTEDKTKLMDLLGTMGRSFEMVAVHDAFAFHPNNGNYVRQHYINIIGEISDSYLLESVSEDITGKPVVRNQKTTLRSHIEQSDYALS